MTEFKRRTTEEARAALRRFIHGTPPLMTIPVDNERDADCILSDVISERDSLLLKINAVRGIVDFLSCAHGFQKCVVCDIKAVLVDKREYETPKKLDPEDCGQGAPEDYPEIRDKGM